MSSLGFDKRVDAILRAIREAYNLNKIIPAAASNSGSLDLEKRVALPANTHGLVLSIQPATGYSDKPLTSPTGSYGDHNLMILGEEIRAAWLLSAGESNGNTRYVSGSSFATPLTAGIAALVLEFSRQKAKNVFSISEKHRAVLWSHRGIREIFQYVSNINDMSTHSGYCTISPWKLLDYKRSYEGFISEIEKLTFDSPAALSE